MVVDTLVQNLPPWLESGAPESGVVLFSHCTLARNLADLPFPGQCSEEEKKSVEDRVVRALGSSAPFARGAYYSLEELNPNECRFLAERRFITAEMLEGQGARGVYVSEDQRLAAMVNGSDHLVLRVLLAGLQLDEAWALLNVTDDALSHALDYAYHDRLGYLTANLSMVGTGLQASVLLHLPAMVADNRLGEHLHRVRAEQLLLHGVRPGGLESNGAPAEGAAGGTESLLSDATGALCCDVGETLGDLYLLVNQGTLGVSEEEILYHVRHQAGELVAGENEARQALLESSARGVEDRVGRALGIAGGARLMAFREGLDLLSSIRLGHEANLAPQTGCATLNELLLRSQGAHLELAAGHACTALELSTARADLFRKSMSQN